MKKRYFINKKNSKPFFSVITVVKNSENLIEKTIKSITRQSFKKFEYIIIDGKSNDATVIKILKNKRNINLFLSEKDKGIYYAMNKGINLSNGKILVFVNSGDLLTKNALYKIYQLFINNKKFDFVFGTVIRHYTKKKILKYGFNSKRLKYNFDFATAHSTGFFIKRSEIIKLGKFDTSYKCSADYDLYYKAIIKKKLRGGYTSENDLIGVVSSGGFSSKIKYIYHLIEETKIRLKNGQNIFFVSLIFINSIVKNFLRIIKEL